MAWPGELSRGSSGPAVEVLHRRLEFVIDDGALLGPEFDERTEEAIARFLGQNGLDVVDVVGERLWNALAVAAGAADLGHTEKVLGSGAVFSVAWSPDGTRLATGTSADQTVRVWDVATEQIVTQLEGHTGLVRAVAWSPDGTRLATGGDDTTVRAWDVGTGEIVAHLEGHTGLVRAVAWSPDGTRLATGGDDTTVRAWDVGTGEIVAHLEGHTGLVRAVAWSPDGTRLATGGDDTTVRMWDVGTGEIVAHLEGHTGLVRAVAWSPDGTRLATGGDDTTVQVWDVATEQVVAHPESDSGRVWSVAWSPDGTRLAIGDDTTVGVWDVATERIVARLGGDTGLLWSVAWSPDGTRLAGGGDDTTVRLWDVATEQIVAQLGRKTGPVTSVAWSPDGTRLASGADTTVRMWDVATEQIVAQLAGHTGPVSSVSWSPDGTSLASGCRDQTVRVWDVATEQIVALLRGHTGPVTSVAWSPDGTRLASGGDRGIVSDVATEQIVARLEGPFGSVDEVAWSPDGTRLASGGDDQTVRLWDVATEQIVAHMEGDTGPVTSVAWSPNGTRLASGGDDQTVRLWDVATEQIVAHMEGDTGLVRAVAWSPDGTRLASGGDDTTVRVWDVATGEIVAHLGGHTDLVRAVAWSPDGTRLASGGDDRTVRVWDLALPAPTAAYASPSTDQISETAVDALGIEDDVRGLAAVVAAKSVEPPLSIGLFADWGGGKSFFMKLLKGRIQALERGGHPAFCSGIRPIDFNAWHYRDADLWSSLASHIFETLATDPVTERRVTAVSAVAIDAALREAVDHREETKRKLDLVRHGPAIRGSDEIREAAGQLRRAAQDLGINAAQIERVSERARAAQYAIGLPLLAVRRLGRKWRWWLGVCVLVVAGLVLAWLSITVGGTVLRSLSRVSWLAAAVAAGVEVGRSLVAVWHRLGPLLENLAQARASEVKKLQDELDRTDQRISELRDQYAGSVSSRRLLAFIQGRSESPDYRERLGVINLIRRDFEEMAELLGRSAAEPGVAGRRIDRIVLYIDDLDRCPSQRVVEVLEAVHLILSIDLFVVVLAVDPRWLVKSLELHYAELLSAVTEDEDITAESHWTATPVNYLEKILQVPYTLRPMTETGYATLMASLLNPLPAPDQATSAASFLASTSARSGDAHPGPHPDPPATQTSSASAAETDGRGDGENQGLATPPAAFVEPPLRHVPIIFRADPAAVEIPHVEARFLQLLRPLIDTPRAAKKLANMYRIVRASARGTRLTRLMGTEDEPGEHRAVALLLAIIVGRPLRSAAFCGAIETAPRRQTWPDFLASLRPVRDSSRGGIWVHKGTRQLAPLDVKAWQSLLEDIDEIGTAAAKDQLDLPAAMGTYQDWLFDTARFSFQTARLVTQRHTGPQRAL